MSTVHDSVFTALSTDVELQALGVNGPDHVWAAGSFDGPQPTPFIVTRWGNTSRGIGPVNSRPLTVYVHDDHGSYDRINEIIKRVRTIMIGLAASGQSANWIIDVTWNGDSDDLADDTYKTLMRNAAFNVVANTL